MSGAAGAGDGAAAPSEALLAKARGVRLLILDVDGVLTDGRLLYGPDGEAHKVFHAQDGSAMRALAAAGVDLAIISGRSNAATVRRAEELGVRHVHLGCEDKAAALADLAAATGVPPARMAHLGDDCADLPLFARVGLACAVADAHPLARDAADLITAAGGGRGAVRELCDLLLRARGEWPRRR